MDALSIPVKSWTTREEAEAYCTQVAAAIPGARVQRHPNGPQVRTAEGDISLYFLKADKDDVRRTPHVKGLYQRRK